MKKTLNLVLILALMALMGCGSDEKPLEIEKPETDLKAVYKATFNFKWTKQDFPENYPSSAHFSKLIGWSHKTESTFFKVGTIASDGIKNMAELGVTSTLSNEFKSKIDEKEGYKSVIGSGLGSGTGKISIDLGVDKNHPSITLATMLAPSPDWYVAVMNINLLENGEFVDQKTVNALTYDAGTDSGISYSSSNKATVPRVPISIIKMPPVGNGKVIATVTFVKQK